MNWQKVGFWELFIITAPDIQLIEPLLSKDALLFMLKQLRIIYASLIRTHAL